MSEYTWTPVTQALPPESLTVELCNPDWPGEKVWPGAYYKGRWHSSDFMPLHSPADSGLSDAAPTHWKHRPSPPVTGGVVKIVYVMHSRPGDNAVVTRTEFEPCVHVVIGSAAGGLWLAITNALATVLQGIRTKEGK